MNRLTSFVACLRDCFGRKAVISCLRAVSAVKSGRSLGRSLICAGLSTSMLLTGCSSAGKKTAKDLKYLDGDKPIVHYKDYDTAIEYPCIDNVTARAVQLSGEPRNLGRRVDDEIRDISLQEIVRAALSHNEIVETSALGGVGSSAVLTNPTMVSSVYDSAIQETGVLFGNRGVAAALADFDTRFATGINWGRNSNRLNVPGAPHSTAETSVFNSSLTKAFASGATASLSNDWNYLGSNSTGTQFPSVYNGLVGAQINQPLLAGSGTEFTRVAGPSNPNFGSITGVSQGVVIARINQDITLAAFETAVQNALQDIENTYWDLYLNYRKYDTAVTAHEAACETWRISNARKEEGLGLLEDELQSKDRLYETRASLELALNEIYKSEAELRRLIGLPMNDGTVLRPVDPPVIAELQPDWSASVVDGLTYRVELRRQKWQIKSLQLQLNAARSLVRPRLDAVANYNVNGFGNHLISQGVNDPATGQPVNSATGSMTNDDLSSWTMGVQFSMPIGLRQARSQARNYELQLAKANAVLASQERGIAQDIATAIQDVSANYSAAQSSQSRYEAASERVQVLMDAYKLGRKETTADLVLRAQDAAAQAEVAYFGQIIAYNKAITTLYLATGRLLDFNNVYLAEGRWCSEAYDDAKTRAVARTHGKDNPHLDTEPNEFVSKGPTGSVELQTPVLNGTNPTDEVPAEPRLMGADEQMPEEVMTDDEPIEYDPQK